MLLSKVTKEQDQEVRKQLEIMLTMILIRWFEHEEIKETLTCYPECRWNVLFIEMSDNNEGESYKGHFQLTVVECGVYISLQKFQFFRIVDSKQGTCTYSTVRTFRIRIKIDVRWEFQRCQEFFRLRKFTHTNSHNIASNSLKSVT